MASTGKKGKKNKGITVPLHDFLVTSKATSWSDEVDEADKLNDYAHRPPLPAAPRAARAADLDDSKIPKNPPFIAYLSNLSYEVEESDISEFFKDLSITTVRLPRDERSGRLKGFGYVEFSDRLSFVNALQIFETSIKGRRIRIDVADSNDGDRRGRGGQRDNRDRDSNYDPEKTAGDWRSGPRTQEFSSTDDRKGPSSGSRRDYGGFKERDSNNSRGYGDRETSWRDNNERRFNDRDNRDRDGRDNRDNRDGRDNRDNRDGRESRDSRDSRDNRDNRGYGSRRNYDERDSGPPSDPGRSRPRLQLQPRTLPREEIVVTEEPSAKKEPDEPAEPERPTAPPAASIFGQAKPVDTAAREREIEERLAKQKEGKTDKEVEKPRSKVDADSNQDSKKLEPAPEPKENAWARRSQRTDAQNPSLNEPGNRKTSDTEDTDPHQENEKEMVQENEEETSQKLESKKYEDNENDRSDGEGRYNRYNRNENRYNDRSYRRDDRDRRDKERRDYDRRDRGYDYEKRGDGGGRYRDPERDNDNRRYNSDREGDTRRYNNERDGDNRKYNNDRDREGDPRRYQDRDSGRYKDQDDHGGSRGPRNDKRSGPAAADRGTRPVRSTQDRERGSQAKDKPREPRKPEDPNRMPKYKEAAAPNYVGTNKYSFLDQPEDDAASE